MILFINKHKNQITAISAILLVLAIPTHITGYHGLRQGILLVATIIAGIPIFKKAFQALRMKAFSIELFVTIAVIGAIFIGSTLDQLSLLSCSYSVTI